jgi:hypothetical protein
MSVCTPTSPSARRATFGLKKPLASTKLPLIRVALGLPKKTLTFVPAEKSPPSTVSVAPGDGQTGRHGDLGLVHHIAVGRTGHNPEPDGVARQATGPGRKGDLPGAGGEPLDGTSRVPDRLARPDRRSSAPSTAPRLGSSCQRCSTSRSDLTVVVETASDSAGALERACRGEFPSVASDLRVDAWAPTPRASGLDPPVPLSGVLPSPSAHPLHLGPGTRISPSRSSCCAREMAVLPR